MSGARGEVHRRERLGGRLNYYYRKAAENHSNLRPGFMVFPYTVARELATLQSGLLGDHRAGN